MFYKVFLITHPSGFWWTNMPKRSKEQIDEDENKVILELKKNSKESIDSIARNCGFSRQKVWRIIKRLEKEKTIWGYHAIVDEDKLGVKQYLILMKRSNKPIAAEKLELVTKGKLKKQIENMGIDVEFNYYVHGDFDLVIGATTKNIKLMKRFCEVLNTVFNEYIADITILEVIFPLTKNGFSNPKINELHSYFLSD